MHSLTLLLAVQASLSLAVPVIHNYPRSLALSPPSNVQLTPLIGRGLRESSGSRSSRVKRTPGKHQAVAAAAVVAPAEAAAAGTGVEVAAATDVAAATQVAESASVTASAAAGATSTAAVAGAACPAAAAAVEAAGGDAEAAAAEGEEDELLVDAAFGDVVQLGGGDIKTDVLYPANAAGAFEIEFQNADARVMRVTENKTPAAPPAGFEAVDCSSFIVELAGGNDLTLQKIDYFLDVTNPAVAGRDLTTSRIGKLAADGSTFIVDDTIGELEFEVEENELTLTVDDLNGEWGVFIPAAAAAAADAAVATVAAVAAEATATAAAAAVEEEAAAGAAAEAEDEVLVTGAFDTAIPVNGGNEKTDVLFPGNEAGEFEVEVNATAANQIVVSSAPITGNAPAGFLFVDPNVFTVQTAVATDPATDQVKIDYFYSAAVEAAIDVNQGVIGKLDEATNTFVTEDLGEFEIELEEKEWTLTVEDLNGVWAMLVPQAAVLR